MARIPTQTEQAELGLLRDPGLSGAGRGALDGIVAHAGDGWQALGAALEKIGESRKKIADAETKIDACKAVSDQAAAARQKIAANPDANPEDDPEDELATPDFVGALRSHYRQIGGAFNDPAVAAATQIEVAQRGQRHAVALMRDTAAAQVEHSRVRTASVMDRMLDAIAADPDSRDDRIADAASLYGGLVETGVFSAAEADAALAQFRNRVTENAVQAAIQADPDFAWHGLMTGERFPELPQDRRLALTESALAQANAATRQRRRAAAAAQTARETRAVAALWGRDDLRPGEVEAYRADLPAAEYRMLRARARHPGADQDDPDALAELTARLGEADTAQALTRAYSRGLLTQGSLRALADRDRALGALPAHAPERLARNELRLRLDPARLRGTAAAPALAEVQRLALLEFDAWAADNPRSSPSAAFAQMDAYAERYGAMARDRAIRALPRPHGFRGPKSGLRQSDIEAAYTRLRADLDRGRIPRAEAARAVRDLEAWEGLLND